MIHVLRQIAVSLTKTKGLRNQQICSLTTYQITSDDTETNASALRIKNSKRWIATTNTISKRRKDSTSDAPTTDSHDFRKKNRPACIPIWKNMTVKDLAKSLDRPIDTVFEAMIYIKNADVYDSPKSTIDDLSITREIVKKCGFRSIVSAPITGHEKDEQAAASRLQDLELHPRPISEADLAPREPVVTIMGHVDHGKTTLLDFLRNSKIAAGEAGGITQHIGAFRVPIGKRYVTFLDTPGHAAFSTLRNRGAQATDIVILVVAADDGVMEQTKESIRMAREANVPIIVAINKIDKTNADVDRTKSMLLQEGIQLEDIGGDVQSVSISALKGTNIPVLLDTVLLQAEFLNFRSEIRGRVEGVILESSMDQSRGKLSTALIQRGILRKSAILVAGTAWAKVRGMFNEFGETVQEASPSMPVEIIGWREIPSAGDKIYEVDSELRAKQIVEHRESLRMHEKQEEDSVAISAKLEAHLKDYKVLLEEKRRLQRYRIRRKGPRPKETIEDTDHTPKLHLVVKGDVDGSVESFLEVLDAYDCPNQCRLDIVHYGIGEITENDVKLAELFGAHIYAFNVPIPEKLRVECTKLGIKSHESKIIYRLVEELRKDIEAVLPQKDVEEELGVANVLQIFHVNDGKKKLPVAGARCTKGTLRKDSLFKLLRGPENEVVYSGKVSSIRHLKNEVDSIKNGVECGIALSDGSIEPQHGDTLVCYQLIQVAQKSEWDPGF